ncbi:hypothetical protein GCM10022222_35320 [Amycolatopsis ultiminotia]|uniref:Uncharacterized protein n=1 Tax=Amycolatopsis ultiminotia TaxID=543629 RepID=A0ABP6WAL5_9PSEU
MPPSGRIRAPGAGTIACGESGSEAENPIEADAAVFAHDAVPQAGRPRTDSAPGRTATARSTAWVTGPAGRAPAASGQVTMCTRARRKAADRDADLGGITSSGSWFRLAG